MNNSKLIENVLDDEVKVDVLPILREKVTKLTELIEALSNISQSSYWKVLKQYEFDDDLQSLISRLEQTKDTTEVFRLQGEIKRAKKYDLESLLEQRRQELSMIRKKLNEPNY